VPHGCNCLNWWAGISCAAADHDGLDPNSPFYDAFNHLCSTGFFKFYLKKCLYICGYHLRKGDWYLGGGGKLHPARPDVLPVAPAEMSKYN
jgi:hypothetical protein